MKGCVDGVKSSKGVWKGVRRRFLLYLGGLWRCRHPSEFGMRRLGDTGQNETHVVRIFFGVSTKSSSVSGNRFFRGDTLSKVNKSAMGARAR